jgi:hypothetical protein
MVVKKVKSGMPILRKLGIHVDIWRKMPLRMRTFGRLRSRSGGDTKTDIGEVSYDDVGWNWLRIVFNDEFQC